MHSVDVNRIVFALSDITKELKLSNKIALKALELAQEEKDSE